MATILPDELKQIVAVLGAIEAIDVTDAQMGVDITFTDVNGEFLARAGVVFEEHAATEWRLYTSENEEGE